MWVELARRALRSRCVSLRVVLCHSACCRGAGKTTTSVGLHDGLRRLGKESLVVLREPSLGPVFGMKGGAAGGGYAQAPLCSNTPLPSG